MTWDTGDVRNAVAGVAVECASRGMLYCRSLLGFLSSMDYSNRINIQGDGKFNDSGSGMVCVSIEEVCVSAHSIASIGADELH